MMENLQDQSAIEGDGNTRRERSPEHCSSSVLDGSAYRLFDRHRSIRQIMGGGKAADVFLWKQWNISFGIIVVATVAWLLFERSGVSFLSISSDILLILVVIQFVWSNGAVLLNKQFKPLPELVLSEEMVNNAAASFRVKVNYMLLMAHDITLGKDFRLFFKVVFCLWLLSVVGSFCSFFTLAYIGQLLMDDHPTLFWTPCAAHCIDLMLHDICKLPVITRTVKRAIALNCYIYNHPYVLNMMRTFMEQKELIRPGVTRFATVFLTLQSIHNQKIKLRRMFASEEWSTSRYHQDTKGKNAYETVMSVGFWNNILYSLKATGPLVRVLHLVDSEKKPAMGYIYEAMDRAKEAISKTFHYNEAKYYEIWEIIDKRWNDQLHRPLHAAGYYLNLEYFYATPRIESNEELNNGFLDTLRRLVLDEAIQDRVETELSTYRYARGIMGSPNAIRNRALWSPGIIMSITIPALYNKYEKHVDKYAGLVHTKVSKHYSIMDANIISRLPRGFSKEKDT